MPIYEYECQKCNHVTDALRKMDDADQQIDCEKCGSDQTHRAHSVCAVSTNEASASVGPCGPCGNPSPPPM